MSVRRISLNRRALCDGSRAVVAALALCSVASCGGTNPGQENPPGGGDTDNPTKPATDTPRCDSELRAATALFYNEQDVDVSDACSFEPDAALVAAALAPSDYADAAACGACIEVAATHGSVRAVVYGRCESCTEGQLMLGENAFVQIGSPPLGMANVEWRYVPCGQETPVSYYFAPASNEWWIGIQVRNHQHAIAKLEVRADGGPWTELARAPYNFFEAPTGLGTLLLDVRVTDVYGQQLSDEGLTVSPGAEVSGSNQFPACKDEP